MTRIGLLSLSAALFAAPAFADTVTGTVLAFDRMAQVIVLDDKSVWSLEDGGATAPEGLVAGDTVTIDFQTVSDNGFGKILGIGIAG
ncbi:hypothetical protein [Palleronia pelagia]|uniref:DUF5666 domain-containing protein n=1 Tax=Palleronia pelagia TaxID=387096 RepID=A0A1H8B733_9RHOB|nr:hypothetical protein [Palleronia pelagia]SEM78563.1 hypothetical protein SAMN04488011_101461 [Palleronia pelagia]